MEPALSVAPTEVLEPSAPPEPSTGITVRWEPAPEPWSEERFEQIVRGDDAWVVVTSCGGDGCAGDVVTWESSDAETWSANPLPSSNAEQLRVRHLAAGAGGYLLTTDDVANLDVPARLWASPDGRAWQVIGEVPSGTCERRSCPDARSLALAPPGTILVHLAENVGLSDERSFGPYASDDGVHWRSIESRAFGVDSLFVESIQSTSAAVLLVGRSCRDCEPRIWISTDGATWEPFEKVSVQPYTTPFIATGAGRSVVVLQVCPKYPLCNTQFWSADDGGRWNRRMSHAELWGTDVTFTGSAYLAVGVDLGCVPADSDPPFCDEDLRSPRYVVLASTDGVSWADVSTASPTEPPYPEGCESIWLAGGDGTALLGSECGLEWRGIVTVP